MKNKVIMALLTMSGISLQAIDLLQEGLEKKQSLQEQLAYKLLGIPETAHSFEILGLHEGASPIAIKKAYRQLAVEYNSIALKQEATRNELKTKIVLLIDQFPELQKMAADQNIDITSDEFVMSVSETIYRILKNAYDDLMKVETMPTFTKRIT